MPTFRSTAGIARPTEEVFAIIVSHLEGAERSPGAARKGPAQPASQCL